MNKTRLKIQAGRTTFAADGGGKAKDLPSFVMAAYNGGVMDVGWDAPVIVDLDGLKISGRIPIYRDHDSRRIVGHARARRSTGTLKVNGVISTTAAHAAEVVEHGINGFPWQASIGASIVKTTMVQEGQSTKINGREVRGPLHVINRATLDEVSFVPLGADSTTSATIAASKRINEMASFAEWAEARCIDLTRLDDAKITLLKADYKEIEDAKILKASINAGDPVPKPKAEGDPPKDDDPPKPAATFDLAEATIAAAAFHQRQKWIMAHLHDLPELAEDATIGQWDEPTIKMKALQARRSKGPAIHSKESTINAGAEAWAAAIVKFSGSMPSSQKHKWTGVDWGYEHCGFSEQSLELADRIKEPSLHQILELAIIRDTGSPYMGNKKSNDFLAAVRRSMNRLSAASGNTTLEVANIFENAAHKFLWSGYQSVNTTWQQWAAVQNVSDFKDHHAYRLTNSGAYEEVAPGGQLAHGGFYEQKYTVRAATFGKIVGMDRHWIINDDLMAFTDIMTGLGVSGAQSIEELAYVGLLSQVGTLWAAGNNNLLTGAGSVLGIPGLTAGSALFENQVDQDLAPVSIAPDRILVGSQHRVTASELFNQTQMFPVTPTTGGAGRDFTSNPHAGAFMPIVSPYLNNTAIKQRVRNKGTAIPNQSATQWFLFANPTSPVGASFIMALLNGRREPFLERSDQDFSVLGMQWRAYHDFNIGVGDPKLSLRSAGA